MSAEGEGMAPTFNRSKAPDLCRKPWALAAILFAAVVSMRATGATAATPPALLAMATEPSSDGRLYGLAYSPYDTSVGWCKPAATVESDLLVLRSITHRIRTYSILPCPDLISQILAFAQANNMTVLLGVWIANDICSTYDEINALPPLVASYASAIDAVMVGNEVILAQLATVNQMTDYLAAVRALVQPYNVALGSVDIMSSWLRSDVKQSLLPLLDVVGLNDHPYWAGMQVECPTVHACQDAYYEVHAHITALCKGLRKTQRCALTETGWPTAGATYGNAVPSPTNALYYLTDFLSQTDANLPGLAYYWFEAFDAEWKMVHVPCGGLSPAECETEYHWGLLTVNGTVKLPLDIFSIVAQRAEALAP